MTGPALPAGAVVGVTGATGHIGQVLVEHLLRQEVEVRTVARRPLAFPVAGPTTGRLVHTGADVRSPAARRALAGADLVFHLAAQVWEGRGQASREAMRQVNVDGTRNILDAGPGAVVLASSAAVYGAWPDNPLPLTEDHVPRPNPECRYATDKLAAELVCRRWDGRFAVVRLCAVLGPHADVRVARALGGYRLAVPEMSGCPQAGQWMDEGDAAQALLHVGADLLGAGEVAGEVLNAGTPDWLSAPDMARLAGSRPLRAPRGLVVRAAELGRWAHLSPFGADRAALICGPLAISSEKAERLLSWQARLSSAEVFSAALARGWQGARRNRSPA